MELTSAFTHEIESALEVLSDEEDEIKWDEWLALAPFPETNRAKGFVGPGRVWARSAVFAALSGPCPRPVARPLAVRGNEVSGTGGRPWCPPTCL